MLREGLKGGAAVDGVDIDEDIELVGSLDDERVEVQTVKTNSAQMEFTFPGEKGEGVEPHEHG